MYLTLAFVVTEENPRTEVEAAEAAETLDPRNPEDDDPVPRYEAPPPSYIESLQKRLEHHDRELARLTTEHEQLRAENYKHRKNRRIEVERLIANNERLLARKDRERKLKNAMEAAEAEEKAREAAEANDVANFSGVSREEREKNERMTEKLQRAGDGKAALRKRKAAHRKRMLALALTEPAVDE
ncbi:hypothetical protein LTR37_020803 [Vermiconidia calcicola]|uniref:Uncharacterized protein n=1 Tax=Vermiconidia calcicola TaxID=1690605 RepID=A0ACC3MD95_9PEZI|nr:hypothetical protein LTR37_020803 [Vermiconidia calcicola]